MIRIMMVMMAAMTDFGTRENSDNKDFRISDFSCLKVDMMKGCFVHPFNMRIIQAKVPVVISL